MINRDPGSGPRKGGVEAKRLCSNADRAAAQSYFAGESCAEPDLVFILENNHDN
jgi:hypothetical protein